MVATYWLVFYYLPTYIFFTPATLFYIVPNVFLPPNKEVEKTDRNSVKSFSALQKKVAIDSAARRQMLPTF